MKDYRIRDDLSNKDDSTPQHDPDSSVRRVLAYGTLLLVFFLLIVYLVTRDLGVLAESTLVGAIVLLVFRYYFGKKGA